MALSFPDIDPVAVSLGPLQIHWYALAYVVGFIAAWRLSIRITKLDGNSQQRPNETDMDDYLSWAILGVLLGGRLGYVLFYNLPVYLDSPAEALKVWHGGMSFHGGVIGVVASLILFHKIRKVPFWRLADIAAAVTPIGFFLGRCANFVNGELFGRVTDVAWGVVFPRGGELPRHPSQLYEAATEGILLFLILFTLIHIKSIRNRPGIVSAAFMIGYGVFRFACEFFREPDVQLGFIGGQVTMGQILCIPMILAGAGGIVFLIMRKGKIFPRADLSTIRLKQGDDSYNVQLLNKLITLSSEFFGSSKSPSLIICTKKDSYKNPCDGNKIVIVSTEDGIGCIEILERYSEPGNPVISHKYKNIEAFLIGFHAIDISAYASKLAQEKSGFPTKNFEAYNKKNLEKYLDLRCKFDPEILAKFTDFIRKELPLLVSKV